MLTSSHLINLFPVTRDSDTTIAFSLTTCTPGRAPAIVTILHRIHRTSIVVIFCITYIDVDARTMTMTLNVRQRVKASERRRNVSSSPTSQDFRSHAGQNVEAYERQQKPQVRGVKKVSRRGARGIEALIWRPLRGAPVVCSLQDAAISMSTQHQPHPSADRRRLHGDVTASNMVHTGARQRHTARLTTARRSILPPGGACREGRAAGGAGVASPSPSCVTCMRLLLQQHQHRRHHLVVVSAVYKSKDWRSPPTTERYVMVTEHYGH